MCLLFKESKSTIDHNRKLLQALDDGLKWVSKYIIIKYISLIAHVHLVDVYLMSAFTSARHIFRVFVHVLAQ